MTDDTLLREALTDRLTAGPPLTLTPADVLTAGRRARTRRQLTALSAAALTLAGVAVGGVALLADGDLAPAGVPAVVVESGVPAVLEASMRSGLPGGEALERRTIYPSDWNRKTPLPAGEEANATDWHGEFGIPDHPTHDVWVGVSVNPPKSNPSETELSRQCGTDPRCKVRRLDDGTLLLTQTVQTADRSIRSAIHFRAGDRSVNVRERIENGGSDWVYTTAQLEDVATDPRLVIPAPATTPPLPER